MYKYDATKVFFILSTKDEVLNSLNDYLNQNKLDSRTKDIIEDLINKIQNNDNKFIDGEGRQHETFKKYKISEIKILLFNNQDKISNDISLILTTNEILNNK